MYFGMFFWNAEFLEKSVLFKLPASYPMGTRGFPWVKVARV